MDWRYQILGALTTALVAVLTAAVPLLVRAAINSIEKRLHLHVTREQEQAVTAAVEQAVAFAEEQARKRLKHANVATPSREKLAIARSFLDETLARQGRPGVESPDGLIEAEVHRRYI